MTTELTNGYWPDPYFNDLTNWILRHGLSNTKGLIERGKVDITEDVFQPCHFYGNGPTTEPCYCSIAIADGDICHVDNYPLPLQAVLSYIDNFGRRIRTQFELQDMLNRLQGVCS